MTKEELDQLAELEMAVKFMIAYVYEDEVIYDKENSIMQRLVFLTETINSLQ